MNTSSHDFVTVEMRGLKASLLARVQVRRESLSVLVRRAVARELGQAESVPQLIADTESIAESRPSLVKLPIKLTIDEADWLVANARSGSNLFGIVERRCSSVSLTHVRHRHAT